MVVKLHGMSTSTCTRRVAVVCKFLDVPYEFVPVDRMNNAHKTPEYLTKQPFGQIPYLDDDGFIVFESRAIGRYVAAKYGKGKGAPQDLQGAALFEQACSIEASNFDPFASVIAAERMLRPKRGVPTNVAKATEAEAALDGKLDGYERILSRQKYLAGNEITLADLFHLSYGEMLVPSGINFLEDSAKRPNVARWWKEISGLPAWQAVKDGA